MTDIHCHAIPVDGAQGRGVHLSWLGPVPFVYAPGGWRIERRDAFPIGRTPSICDVVAAGNLKGIDELRLTLGTVSAAPGIWPGPGGGACQVWTVELHAPTGGLHGSVAGPQAFVYGLRNGKAAAFQGPLTGNFDLGAAPCDRLVFYLQNTFSADITLRLCRYRYEASDWSSAKLLATLQLPIRELMPLADGAAELEEAKRRLLPGESIDPQRFAQIADMLRGIAKSPPRRPIQDALLVRTRPDDDFDEMTAIDPLRMLYSSPLWRRVLGLAYFDADPALVAGQSYDYRVTGLFPADADAPVYGFHTIPSGTALPAEFYLRDCHVRLPQPAVVQRSPSVSEAGLTIHTRRGIALKPRAASGWLDMLLDDHCAVIDLPVPASRIALELEPDHALTIAGDLAWGAFSTTTTIPPGPRPIVSFPQPVTQLRLTGKGFLYAIRPVDDLPDTLVEVPAIIAPVLLADTPLPPPPLIATASSLQAGAQLTTISGAHRPPRNPLGINVRWDPALATGLSFWPPQETAPAPLDATSFQIERRIEPAGPWQPLIGGDNLILGSRDQRPRDSTLRPGTDLMQVFPEAPGPGGGAMFAYKDVFLGVDPQDPQGVKTPQPPKPGTMLRYQVRAVDFIGRPSVGWTQTDPVRLEKHEAPPIPASPDETVGDLGSPQQTGIVARILMRGADDLTADEQALLGISDNAIVLNWGWHASQRRIDPFATQFRIYLTPPLDEVAGTLLSAAEDPGTPGLFHAQLQLDRAVVADAGQGLTLDAGYPYFVVTHTGGTTIAASLRTVIAAPGGGFRAPVAGPIRLLLKHSSRTTRPGRWRERVQTVPITAAERYQAVIRDRLLLTDDHPVDMLWAGVSAADDQPYVQDSFPGGTLPGNESAVATVLCRAKRAIPPVLQPAIPTGPVPRITTREPAGGTVALSLDLGPYLDPAGVPAGARLQVARLHSVDLLAAFAVAGAQILAQPVNPRAGETARAIGWGNPTEQASVGAAMMAGDYEAIDDRFLVLLAQLHPWRERLFRAATNDPIPGTAFDETLPSASARYLYCVRVANPAGLLSAEGAVAHVVVRVPSAMPGPGVVPDVRRDGDPAASLRFRVTANDRLTHVLLFRLPLDPQHGAASGVLQRVANRPDLYPADVVRLRLDDGGSLAPTLIPLATAERDARGWSILAEPESPQTKPVRLWLCTLTSDGVPSPLSGPWSIRPSPAPQPVLART